MRTHLLAAIGMIGACTVGAHTANASVTSVVVDRNITFEDLASTTIALGASRV